MAPRRGGRRTITYNLTEQASRSAFQQGLDLHDDYDDDGEPRPGIMGTSPGSAQRRAPVFQPSFHEQLSENGALLNGLGTEKQTVDLVNLLELFSHLDKLLVEDVFTGCGCRFDRALDILSEMHAAPMLSCGEDAAVAEAEVAGAT